MNSVKGGEISEGTYIFSILSILKKTNLPVQTVPNLFHLGLKDDDSDLV